MTDSDKSYSVCMAVILLEIRRLLKPTGSIYLHCDPTLSYYLKLVIDAVFGCGNFGNEVVWSCRTGGSQKRHFSRKHDILLFYVIGTGYTFKAQKEKSYTKARGR